MSHSSPVTSTSEPSTPAPPKQAEKYKSGQPFLIDGHEVKSGETNGRKWTLHTIDLITLYGDLVIATTFSNTIGKLAENHFGHRCTAKLQWSEAYGYRIQELEIETEEDNEA